MKNFFLIAMVALLFLGEAFSDIAPYLKSIEKPFGNHTMDHIDFIYMINLDERPEKYKKSLLELAPYGITPYRFSAVNGWKLPIEVLHHLGVVYKGKTHYSKKVTYYPIENKGQSVDGEFGSIDAPCFGHKMSKGVIGIVMSHLSILNDALKNNYKTIWVMEDDIKVEKNPHQISELVCKLDALVGEANWDILFTDKDTKDRNGARVQCFSYAPRPYFKPKKIARFSQKKRISSDFIQIGSRYGAYSMVVRQSGMRKIFDHIVKNGIFLPYDMEYFLPNDIVMYTVAEDIVSTLENALSDNKRPNYLKNKDVNGN